MGSGCGPSARSGFEPRPLSEEAPGARRERAPSAFSLGTTQEVEDLHALVIRVGHVDPVCPADKDPAREPELARAHPALPESEKKGSVPFEDLDRVEEGINDVKVPPTVHRHSLRAREVPGAIALPPHLPEEPPVPVEGLDPEIKRVGH